MAGIVIDVDTKDTNANANLKKMDSALARIIKKARGSKRELDGLASVSLKDTSRSIDKADKEIKDLGKSGTKSFSDVSKGSKEANKSLINLKSTVVTLASSFLALKGLNTFNEMGDNITNVQNKLKLVDNSIKNIMRSQQDLYKVSRQTVSAYSETVDLYYKMRRGLEGTSRGHKDVLEIVKTMNIAAQLSGSSEDSTRAAMVQFSQGIAANRLSGQEFNSMAEQMSYAFYGIAKAAGVTAGELRKMAEEGELTVKFVADNILKMSKQANKDWENMQLTASQGLLQFRQSLSYLFGDLNKFYKFTDRFTRRFLILADNIDSFRIKFVTKLETFRLQVTNFITTFDRLTAIRLTWDAFAALDYPVEKFTLLYQHIKRVKDQWEILKASVSDTLIGSREAMVQKLAIKFDSEAFRREVANAYDKSVDEVDTGDISRYANQHLKALSTIDRLKLAYGDLFNELGRYFKISFSNFAKLIPNITTPIIQSFKDIESTIAMRAIAFDDKMFKKLKPLRDKLESLVEIVTIFQSGDDRLSRAWSQLFDVSSLKEFVAKLKEINTIREGGFRGGLLGKLEQKALEEEGGLWRVSYEVAKKFTNKEQKLLEVRGFSLKRFQLYLESTSKIISKLYSDIIYPKIRKPAVQLFLWMRSILETYSKALSASFDPAFADDYAIAFYNALKDALKSLGSKVKLLFTSIFSNVDDAGNILNIHFKQAINDVAKFVWIFLKTFTIALYQEISALIVRYAEFLKISIINAFVTIKKSLKSYFNDILAFTPDMDINLKLGDNVNSITDKLDSAESKVKSFATNIKSYFYDIYDKVVGHSYWPDMIDGVNDYTFDLKSTENRLKLFAKKAIKVFKDLYLAIKDKLSNLNIPFEELKSSFSSIDFGDIGRRIGNELGGFAVAAFLLTFKNLKFKFMGYGYLFSFLNDSLDDAFTKISSITARGLGASIGQFSARMLDGIIRAFDLLIKAAPHLWVNFLVTAEPALRRLEGLFETFLDNLGVKLISGVSLIFAGWLAFSKKGLQKAFKMLTKLFSFKKVFGAGASTAMALSTKLGVGAALAFSSAFLDSVSLLEAASFGVPLLLAAFLGSDMGKGVFKYISTLAIGWMSSLTAQISLYLMSTRYGSFAGSFLLNMLGMGKNSKGKSDFAIVKRQIIEGISNLSSYFKTYKFGTAVMPLSDIFFGKARTGKNAVHYGRIRDEFITSLTNLRTGLKATATELVPIGIISDRVSALLQRLRTSVVTAYAGFLNILPVQIGKHLSSFASSMAILGTKFLKIFQVFNIGKLLKSKLGIGATIVALTHLWSSVGHAASIASTQLVGSGAKMAIAGSMTTKAVTSIVGSLFTLTQAFSTFAAASIFGKAIKDTVQTIRIMRRMYGEYLSITELAVIGTKAFAISVKDSIMLIPNAIMNVPSTLRAVTSKVMSPVKRLSRSIFETMTGILPELAAAFRNLPNYVLIPQSVSLVHRNFEKAFAEAGVFAANGFAAGFRPGIRKLGEVMMKPLQVLSAFLPVLAVAFSPATLGIRVLMDSFGLLGGGIKGTANITKSFMLSINSFSARAVGSVSKVLAAFVELGAGVAAVASISIATLLKPLLGMVTIGGGVGVLALHFFGPDMSFLDQLQWAYDKMRSLVGLQAKTDAGRMQEMRQYQSVPIYNRDVDLFAPYRDVDFSEMSESRFKMITDYASEVKTALEQIDEAAMKQGELTAAQNAAADKLIEKYNSVANRQPQKTKSTQELLSEQIEAMLYVNNEPRAQFNRRFKTAPDYDFSKPFSRLNNEVKLQTLAMKKAADVGVSIFGVLTKTLATVASGFAAIIAYNAIEGGVGSVLHQLGSPSGLGKMFRKLLPFRSVRKMFLRLFAGVSKLAGGFTAAYIALKAFTLLFPKQAEYIKSTMKDMWEDAKAAWKRYTEGEKPSSSPSRFEGNEDARLAYLSSSLFSEFVKALPKNLKDEYRGLVTDTRDKSERYNRIYNPATGDIPTPDIMSLDEERLEAYYARAAVLRANAKREEMEALQKQLNFEEKYRQQAKDAFDADFVKGGVTKMIENLNKALGIKLNPDEFFADSKEVKLIQELIDKALELNEQEPKTFSARAKLTFEKNSLKKQVEDLLNNIQKAVDGYEAIKLKADKTGLSSSIIMDILKRTPETNVISQSALIEQARASRLYERGEMTPEEYSKYSPAPKHGGIDISGYFEGTIVSLTDELSRSISEFKPTESDFNKANFKKKVLVPATNIFNKTLAVIDFLPEFKDDILLKALKDSGNEISKEQLKFLDRDVLEKQARNQLRLQAVEDLKERTGVTDSYAPISNVHGRVGGSSLKDRPIVPKMPTDDLLQFARVFEVDIPDSVENFDAILSNSIQKFINNKKMLQLDLTKPDDVARYKELIKANQELSKEIPKVVGLLASSGLDFTKSNLFMNESLKDVLVDIYELNKAIDETTSVDKLKKLTNELDKANAKLLQNVDTSTLFQYADISIIGSNVANTQELIYLSKELFKIRNKTAKTEEEMLSNKLKENRLMEEISVKSQTIFEKISNIANIDTLKGFTYIPDIIKPLADMGERLSLILSKAVNEGIMDNGMVKVANRLKNLGPLVSFIVDLKESLANAVNEGIGVGIDRFRSLSDEGSFSGFMSISEKDRNDFNKRQIAIEKYREALRLPNLSEAQGKILEDINFDNVVEKMADFGDVKPPILELIKALNMNTASNIADSNGNEVSSKFNSQIKEHLTKSFLDSNYNTYTPSKLRDPDELERKNRKKIESSQSPYQKLLQQLRQIDVDPEVYQKFSDEQMKKLSLMMELPKKLREVYMKEYLAEIDAKSLVSLYQDAKDKAESITSAFSDGFKDVPKNFMEGDSLSDVGTKLLNKIAGAMTDIAIDEAFKPFEDTMRKSLTSLFFGDRGGKSEEEEKGSAKLPSDLLDMNGENPLADATKVTNDVFKDNEDMPGKIGGFFQGIMNNIMNAVGMGGVEQNGFGKFLGYAQLAVSAIGAFSSIGSTQGSAISSGTGGFGSSLGGFSLNATGGFISGPGTGTSDSIPSMLSNGEYVINAKATKEFLPLLNSINYGKIGKYAKGGLIDKDYTTLASPISVSQDKLATETRKSKGESQIINLNITGDISRQTKSEVFKMLPQIANGVNSHNRERGLMGSRA